MHLQLIYVSARAVNQSPRVLIRKIRIRTLIGQLIFSWTTRAVNRSPTIVGPGPQKKPKTDSAFDRSANIFMKIFGQANSNSEVHAIFDLLGLWNAVH